VHQPCRLPVVAQCVMEVPLAAVVDVRSAADPDNSPPLPKRFLRHADEQSVVAVRAVQQSIATIDGLSCREHGVIAAPCRLGRAASSRTLSKYAEGGGVTVSTHIVPQASLHAMAAAVSVGLGMHGPSLGVGGGVEALSDGLLTLAALANTPGVDGWWLVGTQVSFEPTLDTEGEPVQAEGVAAKATVEALALLVANPKSSLARRARAWLDLSASVQTDGRLADRIHRCLVATESGCSQPEAA
jgi:hypothetical protein